MSKQNACLPLCVSPDTFSSHKSKHSPKHMLTHRQAQLIVPKWLAVCLYTKAAHNPFIERLAFCFSTSREREGGKLLLKLKEQREDLFSRQLLLAPAWWQTLNHDDKSVWLCHALQGAKRGRYTHTHTSLSHYHSSLSCALSAFPYAYLPKRTQNTDAWIKWSSMDLV